MPNNEFDSVENLLSKDAIKQATETFINEDMNDARFALLISVKNNGGIAYSFAGQLTPLEIHGLISYLDEYLMEDLLKDVK